MGRHRASWDGVKMHGFGVGTGDGEMEEWRIQIVGLAENELYLRACEACVMEWLFATWWAAGGLLFSSLRWTARIISASRALRGTEGQVRVAVCITVQDND